MSFSGGLLKGLNYNDRVICLVQTKENEADIDSDIQSQSNQNNTRGNNQGTNNDNRARSQSKSSQQVQNNSISSQQKVMPVCRYRNNLLQPPSADYAQKSQILRQKQIEQRLTKNMERQLYYGKKKSKVIEISDVSSEDERRSRDNDNKKKENKRKEKERLNDDSFDEKELMDKYGICTEELQQEKERRQKNNRQNKTVMRNAKQKQPKKKDLIIEKQPQIQLSHLDPHYSQEEDKSSESSIIRMKPKQKQGYKRLRKMATNTNKVKLQNKENNHVETQQCPICLTDLNKKEQKKKGLLPCKHLFCLRCIREAAQFSNRCPYCRAQFNQIMSNGKKIQVEDSRMNEEYEDPDEEPCYICGRNNDFEHLLECEFCEYAYCHTYCDPRLNNRRELPEEAWYCASCQDLIRHQNQAEQEGQQDESEEEGRNNVDENEDDEDSYDNIRL